jgi:hypothetical protein
LNKDLSDAPPSADGPRGPGERGGRGGFGGPGGGFGGPGPGGFGGRGGGGMGGPGGGPPNFDPKKMEATMAMMRELMTPTTRWTVVGDAAALTFTDADGRSSRYTVNDKKEKHQLSNGTIETKTKWENGQLRQELSLPGGTKALRIFAVVEGEIPQLVVTVTPEGGPGGRGDRRPPLRFVYDHDVSEAR